MKLLYILLCLPLTLYGQQHSDIISESVIECHYKCLQPKVEDTFILKCGKEITQFYNPDRVRFDSLMEFNTDLVLDELSRNMENRVRSGISTRSIIYNEFLYKNYPKYKISVYSEQSQGDMVYLEDFPNLNWMMNEDSTNTILGYKCHCASIDFRGRTWIAWYTEDIPISQGPWKLFGLPGLILKAYTTDGFITFVAQRINIPENDHIIFYNYGKRKFKNISREEYLKFKKRPQVIPFANKVSDPKPYIELR